MVFIPLVKRLDTAHASVFPLRQAARQRRAARGRAALCAVGLQVIFIDEIQPIFIADVIPGRMIGVVGGAHGVDVVRLHHQSIRNHFLPRERSPAPAGKLVPIHTLEHQPAAVEQQNSAPDLHTAEASFQGHIFQHALIPGEGKQHRIKVRLLRAPELGLRNRRMQGEPAALRHIRTVIAHDHTTVEHRHLKPLAGPRRINPCESFQLPVLIGGVRQGGKGNIR